MSWKQLFVRYGWLVEEVAPNIFSTEQELMDNVLFLMQSLDTVNAVYELRNNRLILKSAAPSERMWRSAVQFKERGATGQMGLENVQLTQLDVYIAGIVRQLNRLGFQTTRSCDGHERAHPHVVIARGEGDYALLVRLLEALQLEERIIRRRERHYVVTFPMKRERLLDLTERLHQIDRSWLTEPVDFIEKQLFLHQLEGLLSIPGDSGNEARIREAVAKQLAPLVDKIAVDRFGNLFAEKTYRTGTGPTILLNAHLDTAFEIVHGRRILKDGEIWSSSEGILGADDRAGVAVLLELARRLPSTNFSGKVKFIFTVEEEVGLVGASQVDDYFLWDVEAAIVVDRRGTGDIVTSCGNYLPFCQKAYGQFFEYVARKYQMDGWKCTAGGSSDTRIWASHGIESVNLSVGYQREHTDQESVDVAATYRTFQLLMAVFEEHWTLRKALKRMKRERSAVSGGKEIDRRIDSMTR
ncbi:MAG: M28 family peptidase [Solibacillus sp.]